MTVIVEPSNARGIANHQTVSAIARWARTNWIAPSGLDVNAGRSGLAGTPLNGAAITTSGTSLTVSIDTFEAFIGGAHVASDDDTIAEHSHTLPGNSVTTTLYLGYDLSAADTFLFGPSGDFAANDPKIPIVDVTDDGSGVTASDDRRPLGPRPDLGVLVDATFDNDDTTALTLDTGALSTTYSEYRVVILREYHGTSETYQDIQVNGITSGSYYADIYDSVNNTFTSVDGVTSWQKIAGTDQNDTHHTSWCHQVLAIKCFPEVSPSGQHYPLINTVERGVGKNIDFLLSGNVTSDTDTVSRINLFGGGNSTGWVLIYGVSRIAGE